MRTLTSTIALILIASGAIAATAHAGALDQGVVLGQVKSHVVVGNVTQTNRATLGYASQELNIGSVNGGKVVGNLNLTVSVGNVHQSNRATLGYSAQETSIGSVK